jgi:biotin carboxylase
MDDDGLLIVVGSGNSRYREYLLAGAARERRLWLLDSSTPSWQLPYLAGFTEVEVNNIGALTGAAGEIAGRAPVTGVFCYDEALVLPTAHVVEALGLPGMDVNATRNCRDKYRTRQALARAGIPQPCSVAVASVGQARDVAGRLGYPVILKPRGLGASQGVVLVRSAKDLVPGYHAAVSASYPGVPTFHDGVLVEEYVAGPEISVDGIVADGRYRPLFLARKELGPLPYFEETGHVVDPGDPLLARADVLDVLTATHAALGVHRGVTHTEMKLTSGGVKIIEVNARLGGDLIPYLGMAATGVDPGRVAARVATGADPGIAATAHVVTGIRFLYPRRDCTVRAVTLPGPRDVAGLREAAALATAGTVLRLPPRGYVARYGYLICQADDVMQCRGRLDRAERAARLDHEPAPAPVPGEVENAWLPGAAAARA